MNLLEIYQLYLQHPQVSTDSRHVTAGCIFFALKGPNFNGNAFAALALEKGAAYAIIDEEEFAVNEQCLLVPDVLECLQALARHHREQFQIPVLGITGSNGKTTTKELVSAVLKTKYTLVFSPGNLNNHIGVPLTLLKINSLTEFAVIEMGANAPGEIAMLCEIARPTFGLISSIGKAHLGGFGDLNGIIKTKKALFDFVREVQGQVFVNDDNQLLKEISSGCSRIMYGSTNKVKYRTKNLLNSPRVNLSFFIDDKEYYIHSQLIGDYNYPNLQSAIAVGLEFGINPESIITALEQYVPSNNRSQLMKTGRNLLILDAYNANPSSMRASLESFLTVEGDKKAVVLGDMLELGSYEDQEHLEIIQWLNNHPGLKVFLIGPVFTKMNANTAYLTLNDASSLRDYLFQYPLISYTILIKGSRGMALEKITDAL